MSRPVSRTAVIWSIVKKDLKEYSRDRLWLFLSLFALVFMIVIFWILPDSVDESISVGVSGVGDTAAFASLQAAEEGGLRLIPFDNPADLRSVVAGDARAWRSNGHTVVIADDSDEKEPAGSEKVKVNIGLAFPAGFFAATASGQRTTVEVFVDAAVPEEMRTAMSSMIRELAYAVAGNQLPVVTPEEVYVVLGEERVGNQVTPRESLRPLFVFMILLMEMFGMSSLIAREMQNRTVTALLVTPARTGDVLAAKGITGVVMGLSQAVILLAAFNVLSTSPLLLLVLMLLGVALIHRNITDTSRALGITLGLYGFLQTAGIIIARSLNPFNYISEEIPGVVENLAISIYNDALMPMLWFNAAVLVIGVGLIVVSFVVKPKVTAGQD